jgi:hypothetical protein
MLPEAPPLEVQPGLASLAVLERFGSAILPFGKVIHHALSSHLARETLPTPTSDTNKAEENERTVGAPAEADPPFDIDLYEATSVGARLRVRMHEASVLLPSSGGQTSEGFSDAGQLAAVIAKYGGSAMFDAAVYDALERTSRMEGGLTWNCFQIGYGPQGQLGSACITCNKSTVFQIGSAPMSGPFHSVLKHCATASAHRKAISGFCCSLTFVETVWILLILCRDFLLHEMCFVY